MRALSLFSGIGLHDLGLCRAGWEIAAQVEIESYSRAVLTKHWPEVPKFADVRAVGATELAGIGPVDLVTGGFPCQDISAAGRGAGLEGAKSGLWFEMRRIIELARPAWVLIENVPALKTRGADVVLSGLEALGYAVRPLVVGAWAAGAPHRRNRVWIVANAASGRCGAHLGRDDARQSDTLGGGLVDAHGPGCRERRLAQREQPPRPEDAAAFRAGGGPGLADADRGQLRLEPGRSGREGGQGAAEPGSGGERMSDADGLRQCEPEGCVGELGRRTAIGGGRWPARRGEPQHAWEPPRIIKSGVGGRSDGRSRRLAGFARRSALRGLGNANPPDVPELIGRWILEIEAGAAAL